MKNIKSISIFCLLFLSSCQKFVDIPISPQLIGTASLFSNDNTATSAVDGVYAAIRNATPSFENGSVSIYTGLTSDEIYNTAASTTYDPFTNNQLLSNNATVNNIFWGSGYTIIYRTNAILEGLAASTQLTPALKAQLSGEMKVVRALTYFYMVNLFGDVPLITASDYISSSIAPRAASASVYQLMISDLKDAQTLMSNTYPSAGKARPNKQTAAALLARVYLYQKDWVNAEAMADQVIGSGLYAMQANLNSVFLINSTETIWEIASPSESRITGEASAFLPSSVTVKPVFALTAFLLNAFEPGDQRKVNWLKSNTVSGTPYYYPYKYKNRVSSLITEYSVVLRLSEQYLIRAEARAQQGESRVSDAVSDLNVVRNRAGLLSLSPTIDLSACLLAIGKERRVELFAEWGNRWFDLKRTGNMDAVLGVEKPNWKPYMAVYPVPLSQLQANVNLTQNPGYDQ